MKWPEISWMLLIASGSGIFSVWRGNNNCNNSNKSAIRQQSVCSHFLGEKEAVAFALGFENALRSRSYGHCNMHNRVHPSPPSPEWYILAVICHRCRGGGERSQWTINLIILLNCRASAGWANVTAVSACVCVPCLCVCLVCVCMSCVCVCADWFVDNPNAALLIACKCKFETCNVNCKITSPPSCFPALPRPAPPLSSSHVFS